MLDMLILAESELFVGISVSTFSWYLREKRCIEVTDKDERAVPAPVCAKSVMPYVLQASRFLSECGSH